MNEAAGIEAFFGGIAAHAAGVARGGRNAELFLAAVRRLQKNAECGYDGVVLYTLSGRKYMVYQVGERGTANHLALARWSGPEDQDPDTSFYRGATAGDQGGVDFTRRYYTTPVVRWCLARRKEDGSYARYKE